MNCPNCLIVMSDAENRLSNALLNGYAGPARMPSYDRGRISPGIVHLGIGAFHRAHQAVYVDDCLESEPHWGIIGASLRRPDTRAALLPQDGLYTLAVREGDETRTRVVGSICDIICTPGNEPVIAAIASEATRIVTLTVTEKAYCRDPASGNLDLDHRDIRADLAGGSGARSVPGLLVAALAERRSRGLEPVTVVSCDNLPSNGRTLAGIVTQYADEKDPALVSWVDANTAFPSTMVDRIVPATTDEDRSVIARLAGYRDAWPVVTEPFSQWVIEDHFAAGRPTLEAAGALMTQDILPFEEMKLRLLNGSHSTLAYLGLQSGHRTVSDAVADPLLRFFVETMMRAEILPTLDVPGVDLDAYLGSLLHRFANTALKHRTMQIAMDGSQKIPQRLLGTIRDRKAAGLPHDRLAMAVAAWIRHVSGEGPDGGSYEVDDPMAALFAKIARDTLPDVSAFGAAILDQEAIFGADLAADNRFRAEVLRRLVTLFESGAHAAMGAVEAESRQD